MDKLALSAELHEHKISLQEKNNEIEQLKDTINKLNSERASQQEIMSEMDTFGVETVLKKESKIKGLFKYYTAITHVRFVALFSFLIPTNFQLDYEVGRTDVNKLSQEDCLFMVLVRLRHNFGLKDIATRFSICW